MNHAGFAAALSGVALALLAADAQGATLQSPLAWDPARARASWMAEPCAPAHTIGMPPPRLALDRNSSGGAMRPLWMLVGLGAGAIVGGTAGAPPADPVFPYWPEENVRRQTILGAAAGALLGASLP